MYYISSLVDGKEKEQTFSIPSTKLDTSNTCPHAHHFLHCFLPSIRHSLPPSFFILLLLPSFSFPPCISLLFTISPSLLLLLLITLLDHICFLCHLQDVLPVVHYHFSDQSLTVYNFLRGHVVSQPNWEALAVQLISQNPSVYLGGQPPYAKKCVCVCMHARVCFLFPCSHSLSRSVYVIIFTVYHSVTM